MFSDCGFVIQMDADEFLMATEFEAVETGGDICAPLFFDHSGGRFQSTGFRKFTRRELFEKFNPSSASDLPFLQWSEPAFEPFAEYFAESQELMGKGDLEKVVPVVFASAECSNAPLEYFFRSLERAPAGGRAYAFWKEGDGVVGYSPEILFKGNCQRIELMALAGTQSRFVASKVSLLEDPKERHEHQVVVERICKQLSSIAEVNCSEVRIQELPHLLHLQTDIVADARSQFEFNDLMERLHPTPALGGEPRTLAMSLLKSWDAKVDRQRFGAPFGVATGDGSWLVLVGIRSLQFSEGRWRIGSGCGLVRESQVDREWEELRRKRESVKAALGLL